MDIIVFGEKYETVTAALEAYGLGLARYGRWKNSFDTPGEAIEAMLKKDIEREENRKRQIVLKEAGISDLIYRKYKDKADTLEEVIALAKEGMKEKESKQEISRYCKKKGVTYSRYNNNKDNPEFEGKTPKEIVDILAKTPKAHCKESVEINGKTYPTVRAALDAFGFTVNQYTYIRQTVDSPQKAIEKLLEKGNEKDSRGRRKSITVNGKKFDTVGEFCDYMNISVKSLYDRKRRYKYKDIEKCANDYYKLVVQAGGNSEKKVFHRLSVKIDGVVYHGLEDFLSKNDIPQDDYDMICKFYYPDIAPDKWFIVAKRYTQLKEKYKKDKKKVVRGKKYSSLNAVCEEYGVSRTQIFWYRDTYRPGADAWDVLEEYLEYKGV